MRVYLPFDGLGSRDLYPLTRVCTGSQCNMSQLGEPKIHEAMLFTLESGVLPIWSISLYCQKCCTQYYHNYYVHDNASMRTYYTGVPDIIQVAQHFFIETRLLQFWGTSTLFAATSGSNHANAYNKELARGHRIPPIYNKHLLLASEHAWDGFFLHSLLMEMDEKGSRLKLPHDCPQEVRLRAALEARNASYVGFGQEEWNHACNLCTKYHTDDQGNLVGKTQTLVMDGVTLGHPVCKARNCKIPLSSNHDEYCHEHRHLFYVCVVRGCSVQADKGFCTCGLPSHHAFDEKRAIQQKAIFQLQGRFKRDGGVDDSDLDLDSESNEPDSNAMPVDQPSQTTSPPAAEKLRAHYGRARIHNEFVCIRLCGVMICRAPMWGSEALSGVKVGSITASLPPESHSDIHVFDNACSLKQHLEAQDDHFFDGCEFIVDVFHFKTKHKESHGYCGQNCNPYSLREMIDDNGNWTFNTSIAEQTNVWFDAFLPIVREMLSDRYNFLDEMVK
ncbi:hypothetical protein BOTBODRAFT_114058 [Botryobasidium botryosum FD-172 SS1]|uniref:CxC5 like cysteine cluster associated with KDZ domain-containing protein n=1 Tax=Botryobasidium botryosum (strain FD-172 SS1) TaxID=930990 RepID=A0A067M776_BOTB1|nr:hypothetical protein BOTBODRAFT_114058 [Botryobasidium botryosum FD-172 SS1]